MTEEAKRTVFTLYARALIFSKSRVVAPSGSGAGTRMIPILIRW
jgi:hypothetical protein